MNISAPIAPAARARDFPPRLRIWLVSVLLAVITLAVYLPSGFYDFIYFDDPDYVAENPVVISGLTWAGFKWAFIGWHASNWHPLTWLSLQLDCQLFGLNPGADHIVNVLFHAANAVLLFHLWVRLTKACWASAMVAALFAWHPLHVESVAWISERKDVLSTFFGLLAMLAYVVYAEKSAGLSLNSALRSGRSKIWYGTSLGMFALALLAKPMLVTLPFLLLLLDYWPLRRITGEQNWPAGTWRLAREKGPFFLLAGLSCFCTYMAQRGQAVAHLQWLPVSLRLENAVVSCAGYIGETLWPARLCVFYPLPQRLPLGEVIVLAGFFAAVSALAWRYRAQRYFLTGWLWFLGMLVPVIGLVQVGNQAMADRYTYLPIVGLFAAATFALAAAQVRWKIPAWPMGMAAALILGGCVVATAHQLSFWRNTGTLFTRAAAVTKDNGEAHIMLAIFDDKQGRKREGEQEFQEAMECFALAMVPGEGGRKRPLAALMQLKFGQNSELAGDKAAAEAHYRAALRLDDNFPEAHNELAYLLEETGQPDEALTEYQAVVKLRPASADAHENLGTQLAKMGRLDEALREYQAAVQLAPQDSEAIYLIGRTQLRRGQSAAAVTAFRRALSLNPTNCPALAYLARVLASDESPQIRDGAEAVALATAANKLTGGTQPFILGTLAMACAETGRTAEAQQAARTALAIAQAAGGPPEIVSNLQARVWLYEAGQPFRESFTNQPVP